MAGTATFDHGCANYFLCLACPLRQVSTLFPEEEEVSGIFEASRAPGKKIR
jgi:hypothetical protein